jgi:hypothetical protein
MNPVPKLVLKKNRGNLFLVACIGWGLHLVEFYVDISIY